ncbi:MAG: protein phosphatase 2C domain-containing protein [Acidimicrobiia bacterium]|nr:protein phosphatase 2C domain-containing protein [Acidimicrobiia bacterium]
MTYLWAAATHIGLHRTQNQDAAFPEGAGTESGPFIAAVADGMGGHTGGEVASRLALQAAVAGDVSVPNRLASANTAVVEGVIEEPALAGMGTTLTLGAFGENGKLEIGHVGDSRAYVLHEGELVQLSHDHTLVAELLAAGRIRAEDVRGHPQRNLLTRSLGMAQAIEIDSVELELEPGDRVLLCSDGLTTMLTDAEITKILKKGVPEETAWNLVEAANNAGGFDNVTVVIVDFQA